MMSLAATRVVVIGGTSGMGLATVRAARELGAEVTAAGRRPITDRTMAPEVQQERVDVTDEDSVRQMFDRVGDLDHLVVTASPGSAGPFLDQSLTDARSFMDGKFLGSWCAARYAAPHLRDPSGTITFITGAAAVRASAHGSMISAAFAAVEALSRALAVELAPHRVNTIRPGYTDSDMWSFLSDDSRRELRARVAAAMPAHRMGSPEDIAHAAVFLMTNPQVTGTVLEVSGGETLVNSLEAAS